MLLMNESLLQFIWQFQYFNQEALQTTAGEPVQIMKSGLPNTNQGPDFLDARIRVNNTVWSGSVELHVAAADWARHQHYKDEHYKNVVLHVVWKNDLKARKNMPDCPVLELQHRVPKLMLQHYSHLMRNTGFIPCGKSIGAVSDTLAFTHWKERLLGERLLQKAAPILAAVEASGGNWEEIFWQTLARNFGVIVNAVAFEEMAKATPLLLLAKNKHSLVKIESLLMGQSGLLEDLFSDDYARMLQQEYRFLAAKYQLKHSVVKPLFLRMRPMSFPTIRLSQLAGLIFQSNHLLSTLLEQKDLEAAKQLFRVSASDYWLYHYRFDQYSPMKEKNLGEEMVNNIITNTIIPVLFAYGEQKGKNSYKDRAINWLMQMPAEVNSITRAFARLGIKTGDAAGSQALIQLKNQYCRTRRCLECAVGAALLKKDQQLN
jgi:hypothetical protein